MKGLGALYRRELAGLFFAPLAWILFFLTLLYNGFWFLFFLEQNGGEVNRSLMWMLGGTQTFWWVAMFLPPLLTMRMISEESRSGLLEFLLTAPVSDAAVVVGKALAATTFLALVWGSVWGYAVVLALLGAPPDWGLLFTVWTGAVLVSAMFSALGLVASALSGTPLVAAFLAFVGNFALVWTPVLVRSVRGVSPAFKQDVLKRFDLVGLLQRSFLTGALDSAHVVFFLAWTALFLFMAVRIIEARRWLG